jgi:GntR family transcriptional regulator, rspAB operon transcriptional repressor
MEAFTRFSMELSKIRKERVGDAVYLMLRQSILDQTFLPGQRLPLDLLASKLDVSATPIKDAVNRLASEGLIEIRARSGTFVSRISVDDLAETLEIRCALETHSALTAVQRANAHDISKLGALLEAMRAPVVTDEDRIHHEEQNREFHQRIVELSGNRKLIDLYNGLNAHITMARVHYASQAWRSRLEQEMREHEEILHHLEQRSGAALAEVLRAHITTAATALIEDIRRNREKV